MQSLQTDEREVRSKKYSINEISNIVAPIAREYGIRKLAVFGSYARGDATENSDIDFHIIDRGTLRGLFRLASFERALEDMLNVPVDVVVANAMFDDVRTNVEREELIVYDA